MQLTFFIFVYISTTILPQPGRMVVENSKVFLQKEFIPNMYVTRLTGGFLFRPTPSTC